MNKGVFTWYRGNCRIGTSSLRGNFRTGASSLQFPLLLCICLHDATKKYHAGATHTGAIYNNDKLRDFTDIFFKAILKKH